jgi:PAS domain S-box-containing protein
MKQPAEPQAPPRLSAKVEELRADLAALRRDLPAAREESLLRRLADLELAVEEVDVAETELAVWHEELLAMREELETERQRYQDLFESAPDAYLVTNLDGTIQECNQAACALLRQSRRALRGKPLVVFIDSADRAAFRALFSRLAAGQRIEDWEVPLRPRGAPPFPAQLSAVLHDAAGGRDLRWLVRDLSQRKAMEQALRETEERLRHAQRLEAIGRLAGGIAHSFNNLLAAIAFHSELVAQGVRKDERLAGHVEEIQKAGERAATLASQLLAFSRKSVLRPRPIDLSDMVAAMRPVLRQLIGEDVRLRTNLDPAAGAVEADLAQLEQVVLNLVANARDAMPYGGELILATTAVALREGQRRELELGPGDYVVLTVRDTGDGMSEEVKRHLFEPFFTTKGPHQGTGLGLATVYGIVRQSGGDVRVESEPGVGTTFEVFLPRLAHGAPAAAPRAHGERPVEGSEVILLVEDEANIRRPAAEILESRGYTVLAAGDAGEALEVAESFRGPIHLLITDVVLPGPSGSQLAEQLAERRPDTRVLYVSGYPVSSIAHHGLPPRPEHFLQKPFPPATLLAAVRRVLDGD